MGQTVRYFFISGPYQIIIFRVLKSINANDSLKGSNVKEFSRVLREKSFSSKEHLKAGESTIFNPNIFKQQKRLNIMTCVQQYLTLPPELRRRDSDMMKTSLRALQPRIRKLSASSEAI